MTSKNPPPWSGSEPEDGAFDEASAPGGDDLIARLLEETPLLYKARAFAESLSDPAFFARAGERLDRRDRALARAYLDGLGFPEAEPALLGDWIEAADAAAALDRDPAPWEAEEMLRAGLGETALERLHETALQTALTLVSNAAGETARDAVREAAAVDDMFDEAVLNAAAGGLVQAAHGAALVLLAEREDEDPPHPFLARWRLYVRGRWPVAVAGATYNIL